MMCPSDRVNTTTIWVDLQVRAALVRRAGEIEATTGRPTSLDDAMRRLLRLNERKGQ
jgi:Arc/MetJ family transcription regulator